MSEIVHYKGTAEKICIGLTESEEKAKEILSSRSKEVDDYYDSALECLSQEFYKEFFFHLKTKTLYQLENSGHEPDEEIIKAEAKGDAIEYELRYYNGGAGFEECLDEAFDKLVNEQRTEEVQDKVLMLTEKQSNLRSANNLRDFCKYVMHDESDLHNDSKAWIKDNLGIDICYKTGELCQHGCNGLCKESC